MTTMKEILEACREGKAFKAKVDMAKSQFNLDSRSNPCRACGHVPQFKDGALHVCKHVWETLKSRFARVEKATGLVSPFDTPVIIDEEGDPQDPKSEG